MKKQSYVILIISFIIILDQITKFFVLRFIGPLDSVEIFPFLHIVHVKNTGAAFGMFKEFGSTFFIIISIFAIFFVTYLLRKGAYNYIGLSLIIGGATGNLIDRILYGEVIDFIDFSIGNYHWYTFNIADYALTVGIIIILITTLIGKRP